MELLVRVVDKISDDKEKNIQLTKAGDVIVYKPDGSDWGIQELKNPEWRIIHVPGMSEAEAEALVAPELPPDLEKEYILRKRGMRLDLTQLDILEGGKILEEKKIDKKIDTKIDAVDATVQLVNIKSIMEVKEFSNMEVKLK